MTRSVHLGLDIGGTASRWVACDEAGQVLARGEAAGATGHVFNPAEKERLAARLREIAEAVDEAGLLPITLTAGITGYGSAAAGAARDLAGTVFGVPADAVVVMDDIVLAYVAAFAPGEGHLVSAGTGSIGLHIAADGAVTRVGGRGILIDDAGSGSWIALKALDRVYRVLDHSGSLEGIETLARELFTLIGGETWHEVRQFIYAGDRGRIGSLAVAVARAAHAGDAEALDILRQAGFELGELARALLARAGRRPIGLVGRVLRLHPVIFEEITRCLPGNELRKGDADAALAAARLRTGRHNAWTDVLDALSTRP